MISRRPGRLEWREKQADTGSLGGGEQQLESGRRAEVLLEDMAVSVLGDSRLAPQACSRERSSPLGSRRFRLQPEG